MENFSILTKKELAFEKQINKLIPGVKVHSITSGDGIATNSCTYSIYPENSNLFESQYFFKSENCFMHFTSLEAIESILYNKSLRLYNLNNLADPREFSFAGDLLKYNKPALDDSKENIFLLSMCKTSIIKQSVENEFTMWQLYGQQGNGVCIEIDFSTNSSIKWKDYFLSQVYYGTNSKTNISAIRKFLEMNESKKPNIFIDLGQIVCFHKSNLYKLEQEVRILFDCRKDKNFSATTYSEEDVITSPIIKEDISRSSKKASILKYLDLPIFNKNFKLINERIPIPKVKKIILGYGFKNTFLEVHKMLSDLVKQELGYEIPVELSRLTKYFYGKS